MKVKVNKLLAILVLILILPSCNTVSADDNIQQVVVLILFIFHLMK